MTDINETTDSPQAASAPKFYWVDFIFFVLYWSTVFAVVSWGEKVMWPWGLPLIPMSAAYIYLYRQFKLRHPDAF